MPALHCVDQPYIHTVTIRASAVQGWAGQPVAMGLLTSMLMPVKRVDMIGKMCVVYTVIYNEM